MTSSKWIRITLLSLLGITALLVIGYARGLVFNHGSDKAVTVNEAIEEEENIGEPTGDNAWNEMEKLVAAYYTPGGMQYKGVLRLIDDNGAKEKILETHPFEYNFFNDEIWYMVDSMEVINQKKYVLLVDHRNKIITMAEGTDQPGVQQPFDLTTFKQLITDKRVHAAVTELNGQKMLTIDSIPDTQVQGYRIYYNPDTYVINKMLIGMMRFTPLDEQTQAVKNEDADDESIQAYTYYLEINYEKANKLPAGKFNPSAKYLRIADNKLTVQPAYENYEFVNTSDHED